MKITNETMTKNLYTVIMPIAVNTQNHNYNLFSNLGLYTYLKYLNWGDIAEFIIICPNADIEKVSVMVNTLISTQSTNEEVNFRFVTDEELIVTNTARGWYKQQAIKLAVSSIVTTEVYLIVDSDQILLSSLNKTDLYIDDKIKYSFEPYQTINSSKYATNSKWWESSAKYLNISIDSFSQDIYLMGVTPQIFKTVLVQELISEMKTRDNWCDAFYVDNCTEYTLYWLYLLKTNQTGFYIPDNTLWETDLDCNVLEPYRNIYKIKSILDMALTSSTKFCTIQGYFNYPQQWIESISDYFKIKDANKNKTCYITSFYDIDRDNWTNGYNRSFEEYLDCFYPLLNLFNTKQDDNFELIIFIDTKRYEDVFHKILNHKQIRLIKTDEKFMYDNLPMWKKIPRERDIMAGDVLKSVVRDRIKFPEHSISEYTIINHCKLDFIGYVIDNNISLAEYYCWVDFGYCKLKENIPVDYIDINKLDKTKINYTLINNITTIDKNLSHTLMFAPETIGGFFFFGSKDILKAYQNIYTQVLDKVYQNQEICDDDQSVALTCSFIVPSLFKFHGPLGWHKALVYFQRA
jgi:hypothetical protein